MRPETTHRPENNAASAAPVANVSWQQRRDSVRRNLLRANTAVALVLLVVFALAAASVWLGSRATRLRDKAQENQHRAELAETKARSDLGRSYLSEAKAIRLGNALERRATALERVQRAAAIEPSPELRNEAVAALALPDFRVEHSLTYEQPVLKSAFDKTMQRAALCMSNSDVVIVSIADGRELARLKKSNGGIPLEQARPGSAEFSHNGKLLSVRYNGGALAIWDLETARTILVQNADKLRHLVSDAHFTLDDRFVVGPMLAPRDGIAVIEVSTGREIAFYQEFSSYRHASLHPTAPIFAANNGTNVVTINWETGERREYSFNAGVRRTAWSPDGRELVIVGNLVDVHVWDITQQTRRVFTGHKGDIFEAVFDPSSTRLATSSEDGTSRIWDLRSNRLLGVTSDSHITQWGEMDRLGCVRRDRLEVRRMVTSPVYQSYPAYDRESEAHTLDISADGQWAMSVVEKRGLVAWNLRSLSTPQWIPLEGARSVAFHPTESHLFVTRTGGVDIFPFSTVIHGAASMLELGTPTRRPPPGWGKYDRLTFSARGDVICWTELSGGHVWAEPANGSSKRMRLDVAHSSVAYQSSSAQGGGPISISPNGRWVAVGFGAIGLDVCDARTGQHLAQLTRGQGNVQFSPDGKYLAFAERNICRVFRAGDWQEIWQIPCTPSATFMGTTVFSPDSRQVILVTSPRFASLFDVESGRELAELEAPSPAPIASARWTPDGGQIVFSTRENQLDVWKPAILLEELSKLGLGWDVPRSSRPVVADLSETIQSTTPAWISAGATGTVILVAFIATLSLRRHRRLIEDFSRTEALAMEKERELQGEREVHRLKSNFVSMVSHEFRTPLGIIQSSAQILNRYLDRLTAERRREQLDSITRNVRRMAELIDEVLLLGKVEAGQLKFTPEPLDLEAFCRRLTDEMSSATHGRCAIRLVLSTPSSSLAQGDETLLRHILSNLISNAVKYSPSGREVEFAVTRHEQNAVFTIRDHGIGIPAADHEKLFVAFHRASNAGQVNGTGLGLTIVKRCVERHGGDISFISEEGKGTTFTVVLPLFSTSTPVKTLQ